MTLTNTKLINLVTRLGEEKTLDLLVKKMDDDQARRDYHKKYNAVKNATIKLLKEQHPEMFEDAKKAVA